MAYITQSVLNQIHNTFYSQYPNPHTMENQTNPNHETHYSPENGSKKQNNAGEKAFSKYTTAGEILESINKARAELQHLEAAQSFGSHPGENGYGHGSVYINVEGSRSRNSFAVQFKLNLIACVKDEITLLEQEFIKLMSAEPKQGEREEVEFSSIELTEISSFISASSTQYNDKGKLLRKMYRAFTAGQVLRETNGLNPPKND